MFDYELAYRKYRKPLIQYFGNRYGMDLAQDLTQDTFMKLYRFRHKYDPTKPFEAWLWTLAKHTGLDYYRGSRLEALCMNYAADVGDTVQHVPCYERLLDGPDHQITLLYRSVDTLKASQREALTLKLADAWSYEQIAEKTGTSVPAIKSLVHRGVLRLKEIA